MSSPKRPDRWLLMRAHEAFEKWKWTLPTGAEGLTRGELRKLERAGLVSSVLKKLPSGSLVRIWTWRWPK